MSIEFLVQSHHPHLGVLGLEKRMKTLSETQTEHNAALALLSKRLLGVEEEIRTLSITRSNLLILRGDVAKGILLTKRAVRQKMKTGVAEVESLVTSNISEIRLPSRAKKTLRASGINTISDLLARSESDLLRISGFGDKSRFAILQWVRDHGLHLRNK